MHFDAEICLAICCSPTGLERGEKVFLRDKKKDFIPSLLSDLLQEKKISLTFVNFTGPTLLVERLPECLPAISVCSVCAAKKNPASRNPIRRMNCVETHLLIYLTTIQGTTISDPFSN